MSLYTIEISREKTTLNKNFVYKIVTDDNTVIGELSNGESKSFQLTDRTKYIKAKLFWCSSKRIDIDNLKDNTKYILTQNDFLNRRLPFFGGLIPLFFWISQYSEALKIYSILIITILTFLLFGTLTIWRDRWLLLKEKP